MDAGEKEYLYWLCHITPLGAVSIRKLYEYFGSFREIWRADEKTLESLDWLGEKKRLRLLSDRKRLEETRREYEALSGKGIRFVPLSGRVGAQSMGDRLQKLLPASWRNAVSR